MKKVDYGHFARFRMPGAVSVRGQDVYFTVKQADLSENRYTKDLYRLRDGVCRRLTALGDVGSYFLTDGGIVFPDCRTKEEKARAEKGSPFTAYYRLPYDGGEAVPFLKLDYQVTALVPAGPGRWIFTAAENALFLEKQKECGTPEAAADAMKEEADYQVLDEIPFYGNGAGFTNKIRNRLYLYEDGRARLLSGDHFRDSFTVLGTLDNLVTLTAEHNEGEWREPNSLWLLNTDTLEMTELTMNDRCQCYAADPLAEGGVAAVINLMDRYGCNQNPGLYLFRDGQWTCLEESGNVCYGNSVGSDVKAGGPSFCGSSSVKDGKYWTLNTAEDHTEILGIDLKTGEITRVTDGKSNITSFAFTEDGFAAACIGENSQELYRVTPEGRFTPLTELNRELCEEYCFSAPKPISFVNEEGTRIGGWVIAPADWEPGKTYPAILDIHGGPKTVYGSCYFHEMQLWASLGYFVFFTNPTGGDGRGNEFADIRGKYGQQDYRDLMRFTDRVLDRYPEIDRKRVGVTGGSYGGFMTNWIVGHTDRFAAAASQRSIANWSAFYNTSDIGVWFARDQADGSPWENPEKIWEQSPLKYADNARTPTLFIHSDEDYRCPLSEGLQMFTALRSHGVETRMCIFKGENHELSRSGKPKHRVRRLKEITEWFEKYLKTNDRENER